MIYAIGCNNFVKFGRSGNESSQERLAILQCGNPYRLELLAEAKWPDHNEYRIHRYLRDDRGIGEWFELNERSSQVIDAMHLDIEAWYALWKKGFPVRLMSAAHFEVVSMP